MVDWWWIGGGAEGDRGSHFDDYSTRKLVVKIPELEKAARAARDACGHFAQNHALLRTFWAQDLALLSRFWSRN